MIPYLPSLIHEFKGLPIVGDLPLHWFGILVAIGVVIGDRIVVREGERMGLDAQDIKWLNARIVIGGFVVAHIVSVVFYFPERLIESPWVLFSFWSGLSSFGGFLGATLTFVYLMRRTKLPALKLADAIALGLAVGWIFGRIGCFTAHDHPGDKTNFFLAVKYPEGARHDLGLYEALFTIVLTIVLFRVARRRPPPGTVIGVFAALYAPVRFGLDFLRATDESADVARPDLRYFHLTPAQWAAIGCFGLGIWLIRYARIRAGGTPPSATPEIPAAT